MAIKNLFCRGIGFNSGVIGWVVTRGYGAVQGVRTIQLITLQFIGNFYG